MKKYDNFCKALLNLEYSCHYKEPYDNVVLSGLVALFEICFEQAWKAMKEALMEEGVALAATGSPRAIIKEAYHVGLISNEEGWLSALSSRNNVAHSYNEKVALDIIVQTRETYLLLFQELKLKLEEWRN